MNADRRVDGRRGGNNRRRLQLRLRSTAERGREPDPDSALRTLRCGDDERRCYLGVSLLRADPGELDDEWAGDEGRDHRRSAEMRLWNATTRVRQHQFGTTCENRSNYGRCEEVGCRATSTRVGELNPDESEVVTINEVYGSAKDRMRSGRTDPDKFDGDRPREYRGHNGWRPEGRLRHSAARVCKVYVEVPEIVSVDEIYGTTQKRVSRRRPDPREEYIERTCENRGDNRRGRKSRLRNPSPRVSEMGPDVPEVIPIDEIDRAP